MRLADFVESSSELILDEWIAFAQTCGPAGGAMDRAALRDHAREMLENIVIDLRTPQSALEQSDKSKGLAPVMEGAADTAAEIHGADRAESGFSLIEMVSEYRALRASVLRLWAKATGTLGSADLEDLTRFNEAIDQAVAESVERYSMNVDRSKDMFVAILGHDLRSPLSAVTMASKFMLETGTLEDPYLELTTRIARSAARMNRMVGDLLDFTRSRLGSGVPIMRAPMDLREELSHVVDEMRLANPHAELQLRARGELEGQWDCARVGQVMTNLIGNALQHGSAEKPITIDARGEQDQVLIAVHNFGAVIRPADFSGLFSPFKRLSTQSEPVAPTSSIGLGLYIAHRIVSAHGGTIHVASTVSDGTTFTVRLPRG